MADWKPATAVPELAILTTPRSSMASQPPPITSPGAATDNPYAAPVSSFVSETVEGFPPVKRCNFALCAVPYIIGTLGITVGYIMVLLTSFRHAPYSGSDIDREMLMPISIMMISFVPLLIGLINNMIIIYRAWFILQPHTHHSTPGKAVGFLFIPIFNYYWIFVTYWRWAQEWNRLVARNPRHSGSPQVSEGLALTLPILNAAGLVAGLLAAIPAFIIQLILLKQMCDAVNYASND